jgi:hypothetical protein
MSRESNGRIAVLFLLVATGAACHPGVFYRPGGWRHTSEYRWATTAEQLDLEMGPTGGRSGEDEAAPELTIHNASLSDAVVTGGRLVTGAGVFASAAPSPGRENPLTIPPGETRRVTLRFEIGRRARQALVTPVTLEISFRMGSGARTVSIPMQKM